MKREKGICCSASVPRQSSSLRGDWNGFLARHEALRGDESLGGYRLVRLGSKSLFKGRLTLNALESMSEIKTKTIGCTIRESNPYLDD
jgi:hypothetical protein